jgi:hypothetical protein
MHGVRCKFKLRPLAVETGRGVRTSRLDEAGARAHSDATQLVRRLGKCVMEPLGMDELVRVTISGCLAMPGRTAFENHGTVDDGMEYGARQSEPC